MVGRTLKTNLTKKEQSTTTAYKMMSDKINSLKASLKKTQDGYERERQKNHDLDKEKALLQAKFQNNSAIEFFKFLSSLGIGFAINYITQNNISLGIAFGIPSVVVFLICLKINK